MTSFLFVYVLGLLWGVACAQDCATLRDFDPQCGGWKDLGHCEKDSLYFGPANQICPSSCAGCGFNFIPKDDCGMLTDSFPTCRLWALSGHCSYYNKHYGYMKEQCAYSCAGCAPPLYGSEEKCALLSDYHVDCVRWADQGMCQGESELASFVTEQCSYSCNGCLKDICSVARDETQYCEDYFSRGWCNSRHFYHRHIIGDCERTCNRCT